MITKSERFFVQKKIYFKSRTIFMYQVFFGIQLFADKIFFILFTK